MAAKRSAGACSVEQALAAYYEDHAKDLPSALQARIAIAHLTSFAGKLALSEWDIPKSRAYAKRRAGRSTATIARELSVLSAAARHCLRWRKCKAADMPEVQAPKLPPPRSTVVSREDVTRLLQNAKLQREITPRGLITGRWLPPGPDDRLPRIYRFVALAYLTGGRRSALETLTWEQVDLARDRIDLNPKGRAQTNKRRPVVRISPLLKGILERAWKERVSNHVLDHPGSVRVDWEALVDRTGLKSVTPHTMRHSRVTHLVQEGKLKPAEIAAMMGDRLETIERNYIHHSPDYLAGLDAE